MPLSFVYFNTPGLSKSRTCALYGADGLRPPEGNLPRLREALRDRGHAGRPHQAVEQGRPDRRGKLPDAVQGGQLEEGGDVNTMLVNLDMS